MEILKFELTEDYITLPQLLKYLSLISSGGEIKYFIEQELIKYNGEVEFRKRKKCYKGDVIIFNDNVKIEII